VVGFVYAVFRFGAPCVEPVEKLLQVLLTTGVYWAVIIAARLVLMPIYMMSNILQIVSTKPKKFD
jgi:hypothetical protein